MLATQAERTQGKTFRPHRPPEKMNLGERESWQYCDFFVFSEKVHLLMFESFTHFFHEIYERVAGNVDE